MARRVSRQTDTRPVREGRVVDRQRPGGRVTVDVRERRDGRLTEVRARGEHNGRVVLDDLVRIFPPVESDEELAEVLANEMDRRLELGR